MVDVESAEKCEAFSSPVRQLFGMFEAKCLNIEDNSDTKNERKAGTKTIKPVKRKV